MTDTLSGMMSESEFFEHFGVKGMKWGERKEASYQKRQDKEFAQFKSLAASYKNRYADLSPSQLRTERKRIQSKIDKLNMDTVISNLGAGVGNTRAGKQAMKRGEDTAYKKLSITERNALDMKTSDSRFRKEVAKTLLFGAVETAAILGVSHILMSKAGFNPSVEANGHKQINIVLGGTLGLAAISSISGSYSAKKYTDLSNLRWEIDKELKKKS